MTKPNDIFSFTVSDGIGLIEANAGTGKTFSIEVIFLKSLLELELEIHQILLITFMKDVTAQMKARILQAVQTSYDYLNESVSSTPFQNLLNQHKKNSQKAKELLHRALVNFDENAIMSIHGFASKINSEFFLDSTLGQLSNLDNDFKSKVLEDIIHFFWIKNILSDNPNTHFFSQIFQKEKKNYQKFFYDLANKEKFIRFCFHTDSVEQVSLEEYYQKLKVDLLPEAIVQLYQQTKHLKRKNSKKLAEKAQIIQQELAANNVLLYTKAAQDYQKWYNELQQAGAGDLCSINSAMQSLLACLQAEKKFIEYYRKDFLDFAKQKLKIYKKENQCYDYDDIIYFFYKISLQRKIQRYPLVVVDEFQDTDWAQSSAFLQLFPKSTKIILVGDPKQAIFSFRGGDVFSYLRMKERFVQSRPYQLDTNWRSQKEIVENVNLLFAQEGSLLFNKINYFPSQSVLDASKGLFQKNQRLSVWNVWEFQSEAEKISKEQIQEQILEHLSYQVISIINKGIQGELTIEEKAVQPEMICILVFTNNQAMKVKNYLARVGVFATTTLVCSITNTSEFNSWWNFLQSLTDYNNKKKLASVLISPLFGFNLQQVKNFSDEEWNGIFQNFASFYSAWENKGMVKMSQLVITKMKILDNLLCQGNREVTNFYQTLEWFLCHLEEQNKVERNIIFLSEKIYNNKSLDNLNLESDKNTVKIMTIHKSKGLEFPIVFCPYLWKKKELKNFTSFFHFPNFQDTEKLLCYDLSVDNLYKKNVQNELEAENRRLLYVALTRAKQQIHIYTYPHLQKKSDFQLLFQSLQQDKEKELAKICSIRKFSKAPSNNLLAAKKIEMGEVQKVSRKFFQRKNYSFSSLKNISYHKAFEESSWINRQEIAPPGKKSYFKNTFQKPDKQKSLEENIRHLISGPAIGNLFHKILEFCVAEQRSTKELTEFIAKNIQRFFLDESWITIFVESYQRIIQHPLQAGSKIFCLANLEKKNTAKEMEFQLSLTREELLKKISDIYNKHPHNTIVSQNYHFLKENHLADYYLQDVCLGFIDLVFLLDGKYYILDWKSNNLGEQENYDSQNLQQTMKGYNYFLQYFLYYLALDKFLQTKKNEKSIGGVFYLFLRGLDKQNSTRGVFFDAMEYMNL